MEKLRARLDAHDLRGAKRVITALLKSTAVGQRDAFDALIIRASIAVLEEETVEAVGRQLKEEAVVSVAQDDAEVRSRALTHYVQGTARLRKAHFRESAAQHFTQALKADAHFVIARVGLAAVHYEAGDYRKCFAEFKAVLETLGTLAPNIVRVGLGVCAMRMGKSEHAIRCLRRALEVDPEDPIAMLGLYAVYVERRDLKQAAALVTQLHDTLPTVVVTQKFADVVFFRALASDSVATERDTLLALIQEGREAARELGSEAHVGYAAMQEGRLEHVLGHLDDAVRHYTEALQKAPKLRCAKMHLAEVVFHRDGPLPCLDLVLECQEGATNDRRLLMLSTTLQSQAGNHTKAIKLAKLLTDAVAMENPAAWATSAWANRLDPEAYVTMANMSVQLCEGLNRPVDVLMKANAAALAPQDPLGEVARWAMSIAGLDLTGDALLQDGAPVVAAEHMPLVFNYALLLEKEDAPRARRFYMKLLKDVPAQREPFYRLARLASEAGNHSEALAWAQLLQRSHPKDNAAFAVLAALLVDAGHVQGAARVLPSPTSDAGVEISLCHGALYLADAQHAKADSRVNKLQFALERFDSAVKADPHNVLAAHGAACCVALRGDLERAAPLLKRVAEVRGNARRSQAGVNGHVLNTLVEMRAHREALTEAANNKAPRDKHQLCSLALCHARLQEYEEALALLDEAHAAQRRDQHVAYFLVQVLRASVLSAVVKAGDSLEEAVAETLIQRLDRAKTLDAYAMSPGCERPQHEVAREGKRFVEHKDLRAVLERLKQNRREERAHADVTAEQWRRTAQDHAAEHERRRDEEQRLELAARQERESRAIAESQALRSKLIGYTGDEADDVADGKRPREDDGYAEAPMDDETAAQLAGFAAPTADDDQATEDALAAALGSQDPPAEEPAAEEPTTTEEAPVGTLVVDGMATQP